MANWLHSIIPRIAEDEENFELMMNCSRVLYEKLVAQTGHFLDRKLLITERVASIQSVVQPVLQILRLLAASFPGIEETPDDTIESKIPGIARLINRSPEQNESRTRYV
jgi:hypothetical protein